MVQGIIMPADNTAPLRASALDPPSVLSDPGAPKPHSTVQRREPASNYHSPPE